MISYGRQSISEEDIKAVVSVLESDFLTQGPSVVEFEQSICDYTGAKYCVAVANGTAALHLAVAALELKKGSEGITSPLTFAATSNAMIYNGIVPKFIDIDKATYNMDSSLLKKNIWDNTRLIIPVHFAGQPCDMKTIAKIAKERSLRVIEDGAHAIGSSYSDGDKVGSCKYSDMTIFSFHPVKTITTGEGGAITTNSKVLYQKLLLLRSHGITKDPLLLKSNPGPWYYEMQTLGFNYRLTDIQAALGCSQMKRLDQFKEKRRAIVDQYNNIFKDLDWLKIPYEKDDFESCFHLYVVQIDYDKIGKSRKKTMSELKEKGIGTQVHYIPLHLQPYYRDSFGFTEGYFPVVESFYEKALSLPLYPAMTGDEIDSVINAILDLGVN